VIIRSGGRGSEELALRHANAMSVRRVQATRVPADRDLFRSPRRRFARTESPGRLAGSGVGRRRAAVFIAMGSRPQEGDTRDGRPSQTAGAVGLRLTLTLAAFPHA
jgi:hypothetical protein